MPDHIRSQIRGAIFNLVCKLETTGNRAYKNRVYPVQDLPGLIVYNGNEEIEPDNLDRDLFREFTVSIEGYGENDDQLDQIAKEVEIALSADQTLGGLVKDLHPIGSEFQFSDGENPAGVITITYRVLYRTSITAPDVAL